MDQPAKHPTASTYREDRRQTVRYPITGAVQFQWLAGEGQWHDGIGITRDIGKGGVFIESDSIPPVASVLKRTRWTGAEAFVQLIVNLNRGVVTTTPIVKKGTIYMMRSLKLGIVLAILAFATCAFATAGTVDYFYTDNASFNAKGTLYGTLTNGIFTATAGAGTFIGNGDLYPMTLVPTGTGGTGYNFDNLVYFPGDSFGNQVDSLGLMFDVGTGEFGGPALGYMNLCATTGCVPDSYTGYTNLSTVIGNSQVTAAFDFTPTPTPEPSTLLTLGSGLLGLAGLARKRFIS